jgi:hypothetical protein
MSFGAHVKVAGGRGPAGNNKLSSGKTDETKTATLPSDIPSQKTTGIKNPPPAGWRRRDGGGEFIGSRGKKKIKIWRRSPRPRGRIKQPGRSKQLEKEKNTDQGPEI